MPNVDIGCQTYSLALCWGLGTVTGQTKNPDYPLVFACICSKLNLAKRLIREGLGRIRTKHTRLGTTREYDLVENLDFGGRLLYRASIFASCPGLRGLVF
jgi:hypothetical protein